MAVAVLLLAAPPFVGAAGHGPTFALATPTLGQGQWSSDTSVMQMEMEKDMSGPTMFRQMIGYGLHPDLQANLSFPLGRTGGDRPARPARTRGPIMMGGFRDIEASLMWRFHREAPWGRGLGTRRESTLLVGVAAPTEGTRGDVSVGPAVNVAVSTGYASRSVYWWAAAGYESRFERRDDRLGDLYYFTGAFGYRPPMFRPDDAPLDLRFFIEAMAEFPQRDQVDGRTNRASGGEVLLAGPSFLALEGPWGLSGGILFPVYQELRGEQFEERYRWAVNVTYWF